jgi:hypothetical protein
VSWDAAKMLELGRLHARLELMAGELFDELEPLKPG